MNASNIAEILFRFPSGQTRLLFADGPDAGPGSAIAAMPGVERAVLITDENVDARHGSRLMQSLSDAGLAPEKITLAPGEPGKSLDTAERIFTRLAAFRADRHTAIVALGGGMVSDIAGFVAATWMRGVPWVACPTTLLSMIDASLGGKTGVNLPEGKNLVGAYHHPRLLWADVATLDTLSPRDFACGLAESVKHSVALESAFLDWQEVNVQAILSRDRGTLQKLVERNLRIKASVVESDERETGGADTHHVGRAALNFGHSVGHALESLSGYQWPHGECVALGMIAVMELAVLLRKMQPAQCGRAKALLRRFGLPTLAPAAINIDDVLAKLRIDKKARGGRPRFVIPDRLGRVVWHEPPDDALLRQALATITTSPAASPGTP